MSRFGSSSLNRLLKQIFAALFLLLVFSWICFVIANFVLRIESRTTILVIDVALLSIAYALIKYLNSKNKKFGMFKRGEDSEYLVRRILATLPTGYLCRYDLEDSKIGNIDNVVVGPNGIFVVEVKSERGTIDFKNGKLIRVEYPLHSDFIFQVKNQVKWLQSELNAKIGKTIPIQPIIVFTHARMKFGKRPVDGTGVIVIGSRWLDEVIKEQKDIEISEPTIQKIVNHLQGLASCKEMG